MDRASFLIAAAVVNTAGKQQSVTGKSNHLATAERLPVAGIPPYGTPSVFESRIVRAPANAANFALSPLGRQPGIITANGLFFTRNHSSVPRIDPAHHRLLIDGEVRKKLVFTLEDILRFPSVSRIHFLECAGNTGSEWQTALTPDVQHSHGLASCCEWTGVPLRLLLEEVEPASGAQWALAEGADSAAYDRSIPLSKLIDDALLVYGQNGEMLRPEQGYPFRLVLPGFEGSTNVKWLHRLTFGRQPSFSREETAEYTELLPSGRAREFNFTMDAKSVITFPSAGQRLPVRGYYELRGFAWSGRGRISQVDISVDRGVTWSKATLQEPVLTKCFTRFTHDLPWDGQDMTIMSRATDETGYVQPPHKRLVEVRGYFSEYHNNAIQPWRIATDGSVTDARA